MRSRDKFKAKFEAAASSFKNIAKVCQLRKIYNTTKNSVNHMLSKLKKAYFFNKFDDLDLVKSVKKKWKACHELLGNKKSLESIPISSLTLNHDRITDINLICDALADSFELPATSVFNPFPLLKKLAGNTPNSINDSKEFLINEFNFKTAFDKLRCKSNSLYIFKIIDGLYSNLSLFLIFMFNVFIITGNFPAKFKRATVKPLYKGSGSRQDPNNFRPISCIPFLAKLLEKIVYSRLLFETRDKLNNCQHGFKKISPVKLRSLIFLILFIPLLIKEMA